MGRGLGWIFSQEDREIKGERSLGTGTAVGAVCTEPGNSGTDGFLAQSADRRLEALAALSNGLHSVEPDLLNFLSANVDPAKPVMTRSAAANVLAKAKLKDEQLLTLADTIKTAGPLEVTKLLGAYEHSTN